MKRLMSTIKKNRSSPAPNGSSTPPPPVLPQGDAPEAVIVREVTAFCESGAPGSNNAGEEYLHLPAIVDAAESSPNAAREAANTIRRFLSKEYYARGYAQYNAIMLARILTDNPGRPFTKNFDDKFVTTIKQLLRDGKDQSVQQILRETLDYVEVEKASTNDSLGPLLQMWKKEKSKGARFPSGPAYGMRSSALPHHQSRAPRTLPPPEELAARIEEAKTTARLLIQTVQSTPQSELIGNDLVKEFADRSRSAHKSIQNYMNCENPSPDEDTMLTLIETNDQLNVAMSKHHRALLQARKAAGVATPSPQPGVGTEPSSYVMPQHTQGQNVYSSITQPGTQPPRDPYSASPPRSPPERAPTLPLREDAFSSPVGPPPFQRPQHQQQNTYEYEDAYSAPSGPPPGRTGAEPYGPVSPVDARGGPQQSSATAAYGVSDNPFSDDAYATEPSHPPPPPQKQPYSLFDRARHHLSHQNEPQPQNQHQTTVEEREQAQADAQAREQSQPQVQVSGALDEKK